MKCTCGGELKKAKLANFDFTAYSGLPARLVDAPGLRCTKCSGETLDGQTIEDALMALTGAVLELQHRLDAEHARFLRKRLGMTQKELAARMGVRRETVAEWETSKDISPEHDYILRAIAYQHLVKERPALAAWDDWREPLEAVRKGPRPARRPAPFVIDEGLRKMRAASGDNSRRR